MKILTYMYEVCLKSEEGDTNNKKLQNNSRVASD